MLRLLLKHESETNASEHLAMSNDVLLEQPIREASEHGHLDVVKALLAPIPLNHERSKSISSAILEATTHGHHGMIAGLRALSQSIEGCCLLGDELVAMAGTRPAEGFNFQNRASNIFAVAILFDELAREYGNSFLYVR